MSTDAQLPGQEIVDPGLADLRAGCLSAPALAVLAAAPRLRSVGVEIPVGFDEQGASLRLYALLARELGDGAHSRHHALMRRLVSYAATAHALGRGR